MQPYACPNHIVTTNFFCQAFGFPFIDRDESDKVLNDLERKIGEWLAADWNEQSKPMKPVTARMKRVSVKVRMLLEWNFCSTWAVKTRRKRLDRIGVMERKTPGHLPFSERDVETWREGCSASKETTGTKSEILPVWGQARRWVSLSVPTQSVNQSLHVNNVKSESSGLIFSHHFKSINRR